MTLPEESRDFVHPIPGLLKREIEYFHHSKRIQTVKL